MTSKPHHPHEPTDQPTLFVTRPHLPPLSEVIPYLEQIWQSQTVTNGGPLHQRLEAELADYLGVKHLSLFTNATIALVTALQALRVTGEVITTPFSFVATAHALLWNGIRPVFADIDEHSLNLDPVQVEALITPQTTAVMPVHCYGRPADTEAFSGIAERHGVKVIYDAAHAFGVRCHCDSLFQHGDLSVLSFHATKVFNTFEGGAIVSHDAAMKRRIDHLKNFGFADEVTVVAPGINGKMSEFNAALGLAQLPHMPRILAERARIDARYRSALSNIPGLRCIPLPNSRQHNYSYFPVLVEPECGGGRDAVYAALKQRGIHARRYFYPLISDMPMYRGLPSAHPDRLPVAHRMAARALCLPIYPDLSAADQDRVIEALHALCR